MTQPQDSTDLRLHELQQVDRVCQRFENAFKAGSQPRIESHVAEVEPQLRDATLHELVLIDFDYQTKSGKSLDPLSYRERFPDDLPVINRAINWLQREAQATRNLSGPSLSTPCPHCGNVIQLLGATDSRKVVCPACSNKFSVCEPETPSASPPTRLGRFELLEQVGIGAFGSVWRANDTQLQRQVAVKIPRKSQLDAEEADLFLREARAAAQLRHPGIVSVHEVGRADNRLFIVCDFIEGTTLEESLKEHSPTFKESADLCATVADALQHAHEQGVVHRDLKPSNIMLDPQGKTCVMDFGLAKQELGDLTITIDGRVLGTPAYMSPEQAKGLAHKADRRSDIYSLGVILFEMITKRLPFTGAPRKMMHHVIHSEPPGLRKINPRIPRDLEVICLRCLEKDPKKRYAHASDLAADLRRFRKGEPVEAHKGDWRRGLRRWASREPTLAAHWAALAAILAVGQTYFMLFGEDLQYHLNNVTVIVIWAIAAFLLQKLANLPAWHRRAGIGWAVLDPVLFTVALYPLDEPRDALLAGYLLMVVATGFFRRISIIIVTTLTSLICFAGLVAVTYEEWTRKENCAAFAAMLLITGGLVAIQVRRTKKLSEF